MNTNDYRTMGNKEFVDMMRSTFESLMKLTEFKGQEYTEDQAHDNQHQNFDDWAAELGMLPEQALQVMLNKHLTSIKVWVKRLGRERGNNGMPIMSEPMEGRFDDALLYIMLLKGMYIRRMTSRGIEAHFYEGAQTIIGGPVQAMNAQRVQGTVGGYRPLGSEHC